MLKGANRSQQNGPLRRSQLGESDSRSLAELLLSDLEGDVGSSKSRAGKSELLLNDGGVGVNVDRLEVDLDSLDGRDGAGSLGEDSRLLELLHDLLARARRKMSVEENLG